MTCVIASMRARVRLRSPVRAPDDMGGAAVTWVDEGDVWAAIEVDAPGRLAAFDSAVSLSRMRVTINRGPGVRTGWRVVWGARELSVLGVRDEGGARITLVCEEELL